MLLITYSNLYSFDGERKGFILGGGIGAGFLSNSEIENRAVFVTNFKIGYAPSNTLEIYYLSNVSWWGVDDITFTSGLSAIAATFYLDNTTETGWFVTGGLGLSAFSAPFEPDLESSSGFGLIAGGGYEFSSHWNVELDLKYSSISNGGPDLNIFEVLITINVLAF